LTFTLSLSVGHYSNRHILHPRLFAKSSQCLVGESSRLWSMQVQVSIPRSSSCSQSEHDRCRDITQATRRRYSTSQDQHRRKKQSEQQGVNGNVPVPHTSCPVPGTENDISQSVVLDLPHPRNDLRFPIIRSTYRTGSMFVVLCIRYA
jgi:hypothetical protein